MSKQANQNRRRSLPDMSGLPEPLLRILKCKMCSELMQPPIHQCFNGHSFCPNCYYRNKNCPVCCLDFTEKRNMVMESLLNGVKLPCDNADRGCVETVHVSEKAQHVSECSFYAGRYQCLAGQGPHGVPRCLWSGHYEQLQQHVFDHHPHWLAVYSKGCITFQCNLAAEASESVLTSLVVFGKDELLWWQRRHSAAERRYYAVLQHVCRPRRKTTPPSYHYAVQFRAQCGSQKVCFANHARPHTESVAKIFKAGTCVVLDLPVLRQLVNKDGLSRYQLSIAKGDGAELV